jgi:hypothetical protein
MSNLYDNRTEANTDAASRPDRGSNSKALWYHCLKMCAIAHKPNHAATGPAAAAEHDERDTSERQAEASEEGQG